MLDDKKTDVISSDREMLGGIFKYFLLFLLLMFVACVSAVIIFYAFVM